MGRLRSQRGQELVEFCLVAPIVFLLVLGAFDLMRVVEMRSAVADAARQGARQAVANATAADQPFGSSNGQPCSGRALTASATGTGCLTDAQVKATVDWVLGPIVSGSTVYTATPGACPTPPAGAASVCVSPDQTTRASEWTGLSQQGSFVVSVTVISSASPLTPVVAGIFPAVFSVRSTTAMVAEY